jgi:hypothetical protein
MAAWLMDGVTPEGFQIEREAELKGSDEQKPVVRYGRHPLDIDEVRAHLVAGKMPTRLALSWRDRVAFSLAGALYGAAIGAAIRGGRKARLQSVMGDHGAACGAMQLHDLARGGVSCSSMLADRRVALAAGLAWMRAMRDRCGSVRAGLRAFASGSCLGSHRANRLVTSRCSTADTGDCQ